MKRLYSIFLVACFTITLPLQAAVPVFHYTAHGKRYTLVGSDPSAGGTTKIPVVLVPITLSFPGHRGHSTLVFPAQADAASVVDSPIFKSFAYPSGETTQYADALLRASVPHASSWHTLLAPQKVVPLAVTVPAADGYTLFSWKTGRKFAVVDLKFLVRTIFKRLPAYPGELVIAYATNATYYALNDATVCCSWGTHGVAPVKGESFILSTYLNQPPSIIRDQDIQPLTQQLAEFLYDPMHDPLYSGSFRTMPGNHFAPWKRPVTGGCGGEGVGSNYYELEPTDVNLKNNFPQSPAFTMGTSDQKYHVQNIALLSWYLQQSGDSTIYSFPDSHVLTTPATTCHWHTRQSTAPSQKADTSASSAHSHHRHWLVGYWVSRAGNGQALPLRNVSPQWDVVIVSFASPVANAPEGTLEFHAPRGATPAEFKSEIAYLKSRGQKVMISLGGGGQFVHLGDAGAQARLVRSVEQIVTKWGFQGIDIDFEAPSLNLAPGDTDFRHPRTPSIVHLIGALKELHHHFGQKFMISLVPEGTQIPAGFRTYGGQFGSYLPIVYALRHILAFVDVQEYNTPPLEGLDDEIYQVHTLSYYAAMTELLLHGFPMAGDKNEYFPGLPARQVVTGFLVNYADPARARAAMHLILTGKGAHTKGYHLLKANGYPDFLGAMFWNIDDDWAGGSKYSSLMSAELHGR